MQVRRNLNRHLILILLASGALGSSQRCLGDEPFAWGDAVAGLRVGIACSVTNFPSNEQPLFNVQIQNVSQHSIVIPAPSAYMLRKEPKRAAIHAQPLRPEIERVEGHEATGYITGGDGTNAITQDVSVLEAGQAVTIQGRSLHYQAVGQLDTHRDNASLQQTVLLPESAYRIRFVFENQASEVSGQKLWTGKAISGPLTVRITTPPLGKLRLEGGFSLAKTNYFTGEPIWVTFAVTNTGAITACFPDGGRFEGAGRDGRYSISATRDNGQAVGEPVQPMGIYGGLGTTWVLKPGETYSREVLANFWCAFTNAGRYALTCKRTLNLLTEEQRLRAVIEEAYPAVQFQTRLSIRLSEDQRAMADYVKTLPARLNSRPADDKVLHELRALANARCAAALPAIEQLALTEGNFQREAVEWLGKFQPEQAAPILRKVAETSEGWTKAEALKALAHWNLEDNTERVLAELRSSDAEAKRAALLAVAQKPNPAWFTQLLGMGEDPDAIVRRYLSAALAAFNDQRAVPVLRKRLLDADPDRFIRIWAAQALGKLGHKDGVAEMMDLWLHDKTGARHNALAVLMELTGQDYGDDTEAWREWWEREGKKTYSAIGPER